MYFGKCIQNAERMKAALTDVQVDEKFNYKPSEWENQELWSRWNVLKAGGECFGTDGNMVVEVWDQSVKSGN